MKNREKKPDRTGPDNQIYRDYLEAFIDARVGRGPSTSGSTANLTAVALAYLDAAEPADLRSKAELLKAVEELLEGNGVPIKITPTPRGI